MRVHILGIRMIVFRVMKLSLFGDEGEKATHFQTHHYPVFCYDDVI